MKLIPFRKQIKSSPFSVIFDFRWEVRYSVFNACESSVVKMIDLQDTILFNSTPIDITK